MKDELFTIEKNDLLCKGTYLMRLKGDTSRISGPGQFVNIKIEGLYLRRPMSIACYDFEGIDIIYKIVGRGTAQMAAMEPGDTLSCLCPLGNGFDLSQIPKHAILTGGGAGAMPIYQLAKILTDAGMAPHVVIGFNNEEEMFFAEEFKAVGCDLTIATMDGSVGVKGTVVDAMKKLKEEGKNDLAYACVCGPDPMMKAVSEITASGQYDLGGRMACGFGACMGCTIETAKGPARVCKEGPIFRQEDIIW